MLGQAKRNQKLILNLRRSYGQGFVPDDANFKALGLNFDGSNLNNTVTNNYSSKLEKVKNLMKIWANRNLTVYGRITLIKCFLISQFVYLISPLPSPDNKTVKTINGILYKFLWGGGREKLKRELINQPKKLGGLEMINFEDFVIGLKVKLIYKLLDPEFNHPWKKIAVNQLRYPDHPVISLEIGIAKSNRYFTQNLLSCLESWKYKVAECRDQTINHCVWGRGVPGVGQNIPFNEPLINKNILYISDFVDENGQFRTYDRFRYHYNIRQQSFTKTEYANIVIALRRFHSQSNNKKSLSNIGENINLTIFTGENRNNLALPETKKIREMMIMKPLNSFLALPQLKKWSDSLTGLTEELLGSTFDNLYHTTNHMKLIQHQYKILTMIATSKLMRYKMKISPSFHCVKCPPGSVETLEHIYINCPRCKNFFEKVENLIRNFIDPSYPSDSKQIRLTCSHNNKAINFLNLATNWYVGRKVQYDKDLHWDEFLKFINIFMEGERVAVTTTLKPILESLILQ